MFNSQNLILVVLLVAQQNKIYVYCFIFAAKFVIGWGNIHFQKMKLKASSLICFKLNDNFRNNES